MEGASKSQLISFQSIIEICNPHEVSTLPKFLTDSRIKHMQHRIFWSRNTSQSSLEKAKANMQLPHFDKLKQDKELHSRSNLEITNLSKKLSLPKIKGMSVSLHFEASQKQKNSKSNYKNLIQNVRSLDQNRNTHIMRKSNKNIDPVIVRYNERCINQVEPFALNLKNHSVYGQTQASKKLQCTPRQRQKQNLDSEKGGYIPKEIVHYLKKYLR